MIINFSHFIGINFEFFVDLRSLFKEISTSNHNLKLTVKSTVYEI